MTTAAFVQICTHMYSQVDRSLHTYLDQFKMQKCEYFHVHIAYKCLLKYVLVYTHAKILMTRVSKCGQELECV